MLTEPEDDPRLENVADKLTTLRRQIDEADWNGEDVTNVQRQMAKRLTQMVNEGTLWLPKF
jgi:hypothetical protein